MEDDMSAAETNGAQLLWERSHCVGFDSPKDRRPGQDLVVCLASSAQGDNVTVALVAQAWARRRLGPEGTGRSGRHPTEIGHLRTTGHSNSPIAQAASLKSVVQVRRCTCHDDASSCRCRPG